MFNRLIGSLGTSHKLEGSKKVQIRRGPSSVNNTKHLLNLMKVDEKNVLTVHDVTSGSFFSHIRKTSPQLRINNNNNKHKRISTALSKENKNVISCDQLQ